MFSWWKVPTLMLPPGNVILVCISSAKETLGRPMITPLVENGNFPLNGSWKVVMSSCMAITAALVALRAAVMPDACAL